MFRTIKFSELKNYNLDPEEIDAMYLLDQTKATEQYKQSTGKMATIKDIDRMIANPGYALHDYLASRIFSATEIAFFTVQEDKILLRTKGGIEKLAKKIALKSKALCDKVFWDVSNYYKPDVHPTDLAIGKDSKGTKYVNLAKQTNFFYEPEYKFTKQDISFGEDLYEFIFDIIVSRREDEMQHITYCISRAMKKMRSETILFLCSLGGVGKTFFTDIISAMFGDSFGQSGVSALCGDQSGKFNAGLLGRAIIAVSETAGAGMRMELMQGCKSKSTSTTIEIEHKFSDQITVNNIINIWIISNYFGDIELTDRRVFAPTINTKRMNNHEYFKNLESKKTTGALQWLFNKFYSYDCSKIEAVPDNEHKLSAKFHGMQSPIKFLFETYLVKNQYEFKCETLRNLHVEYLKWCKQINFPKPWTLPTFQLSLFHYLKQQVVGNKVSKEGNAVRYDLSYEVMKNIIIGHKLCSIEQLEDEQMLYKQKMFDMFGDSYDEEKEEDKKRQQEVYEKIRDEIASKNEKEDKEKEHLRNVNELQKVKLVVSGSNLQEIKKEEIIVSESDDENDEYKNFVYEPIVEEKVVEENEDSEDEEEEPVKPKRRIGKIALKAWNRYVM